MENRLEIRIPGSFVVLQGVEGDGLSNTIDSLPNEPVCKREMSEANPQASADLPLNIIGSTLHHQGKLLPSGRNSSMRTVVEPPLSAPLDESYIVVHEDENPSTSARLGTIINDNRLRQRPSECVDSSLVSNLSLSSAPTDEEADPKISTTPAITQDDVSSINQWQEACQQQEYNDYCEWHSRSTENMSFAELQRRLLPSTIDVTATTSTTKELSSSAWWRAGPNHLALLDRLPFSSGVSGDDPAVLDRLPPGTVLCATALYTLHTDTLAPVHEMEAKAMSEDRVDPLTGERYSVYPPGRDGWTQILRVDQEGTSHHAYVVLSRNGYSFLGPGILETFTDLDCWYWRVTCATGAYVRQGLDLTSTYIATIPHGSLVQVRTRSVNSMGIPRLQVAAWVDTNAVKINHTGDNREVQREQRRIQLVEGWCSEILNPVSGQSGSIARPLALPVPMICRVAVHPYAIIREGKEPSSLDLGRAPEGSVVTVTKRSFSEHPPEQSLVRLQLAGKGGWVSLRMDEPSPNNGLQVEMIGLDPSFDPCNPGLFHMKQMKRVYSLQDHQISAAASQGSTPSSGLDDDELYTEAALVTAASSVKDTVGSTPASLSFVTSTSSPQCLYTRYSFTRINTTSNRGDNSIVTKKASNANGPPEDLTCLICLNNERTATIVHKGTGHIACCLVCARILKARNDPCPVCRLPIESVIQHFYA